MTEKRFTVEEWDIWDYADSMLVIFKDGEFINNKDVVDLLNELHEENEQLKQRISELELLNDGLNHALKYIKRIDVEIDVGDDGNE